MRFRLHLETIDLFLLYFLSFAAVWFRSLDLRAQVVIFKSGIFNTLGQPSLILFIHTLSLGCDE